MLREHAKKSQGATFDHIIFIQKVGLHTHTHCERSFSAIFTPGSAMYSQYSELSGKLRFVRERNYQEYVFAAESCDTLFHTPI